MRIYKVVTRYYMPSNIGDNIFKKNSKEIKDLISHINSKLVNDPGDNFETEMQELHDLSQVDLQRIFDQEDFFGELDEIRIEISDEFGEVIPLD